MMAAITNGTTPLTFGTTQATAANAYSTTFDGTTNNWPAADANKLVNGTALAGGLALKQNKITTGLVAFPGAGNVTLPALVATNAAGTALNGNTIGILDSTHGGGLAGYSSSSSNNTFAFDNFIPTVRAVADGLYDKQTKIPSNLLNGYQSVLLDGMNTGDVDKKRLLSASDVANHTGGYLGGLGGFEYEDNMIPTIGAVAAVAQPKITAHAANAADSVLTDSPYDGVVGKKTILTGTQVLDYGWDYYINSDDMIPTAGAVAEGVAEKQSKIQPSGYAIWRDSNDNFPYIPDDARYEESWLNANVKGTGLVTRTATNGVVGERKIFESTDVANYHAQNLNPFEQDIQDISIPTVGAMMTAMQTKITAHAANVADSVLTDSTTAGTVQKRAIYDGSATYVAGTHANQIPTAGAMMAAITNGVTKITWSSTETTAVQNYSTTFDGTTNNWPAADANKLVDGTALATALAEKQNKITANNSTTYPNGSVVTYGATAGTPGQVAIATAPSYNQTTGALENGTQIATIAAVDTMQAKIPAHAANAADSVLTDSATAGTVQKRALYDGTGTYTAATDAGKIATAAAIETRQKKRVCVGWATGHENDDDYCYFWDWPD